MEVIIILIGLFILYLVIANAVRVGIKEAYHDLKKDIIKDFNLKVVINEEKNLNEDDVYCSNSNVDEHVKADE